MLNETQVSYNKFFIDEVLLYLEGRSTWNIFDELLLDEVRRAVMEIEGHDNDI